MKKFTTMGASMFLAILVKHLCEEPEWTKNMMASDDKQKLIDLVEEHLIMEHV